MYKQKQDKRKTNTLNQRVDEANENTTFDDQSFSIIKLNNGTVLYLREVNKFLALVCILREDNFNEKQGIIDYNFQCFRQALREVFDMKNLKFKTDSDDYENDSSM